MRTWLNSLRQESQYYFSYIAGLFVPDRQPRYFDAHPNEPGDVSSWSAPDWRLLIEEGRRQQDRQLALIEALRTRAQFLFTTAVTVFVITGVRVGDLIDRGTLGLAAIGALGLSLDLLSALGAAALMFIRADLGTIDAAKLSQQAPPIERYLAGAYSRLVRPGENTIATHNSVFRRAAFLLVLGAPVTGVLWIFVH
jgi:hypothetical protein